VIYVTLFAAWRGLKALRYKKSAIAGAGRGRAASIATRAEIKMDKMEGPQKKN
jgi:hypothetical protein